VTSPARAISFATVNPDLVHHWPLDPDVTYLNHGSLGACPWPVLRAQDEWRTRLERGPVQFMDYEMEAHLDRAREHLGEFLGARGDDLVFVPNATAGLNSVLRSLRFEPDDEILSDDHEYNACLNANRFVAERTGARLVVANVPLPVSSPDQVVDAILERVTPKTRLAVISHVTSPTALVFPVAQVVAELAERGIDALIDGAHAPGMLPLDLDALGAAYYTGNCHKWLCAPKGSGFLHVRRDRQERIHPLSTSHGPNSPRRDRSRFRLEFDWTGTADPTPFLSVPAALDFIGGLVPGGWPEVMRRNHELAMFGLGRLREGVGATSLGPEAMLGSMAAVELPPGIAPEPAQATADDDGSTTRSLDPLRNALYRDHAIEVPVFPWPHTSAEGPARRLLRVSAQLYNSPEDYERLSGVLAGAAANPGARQ
jgi:isopenicillin-N epimerase